MRRTIAVALSGGIDSLVTAAMLRQRGNDLIGMHFVNGYEAEFDDAGGQSNVQTDITNVMERARTRLIRMTDRLRIPIHIVDLRSEFQRRVVDYFTHTYQSGKTPNPCLTCNPAIKFGILLDKARSFGATHLATGHYARIRASATGRMQLFRGKDPQKEQSYFLARLTQDQLASAVMPLGDYKKVQTRQIAREKGLQPAASQESQDICFIRSGDYGEFLKRQPGFTAHPGPIEDTGGNLIGRHSGLHQYTIGQRRGINCPASEPYYVVRLDTARNCLIVGFQHHLRTESCRVSHINWIARRPSQPQDITIRIRYRHRAVDARLNPLNNTCAEVVFKTPQSAICPGQGAVFYQGDEVLGGGWIQ
jgi:tRNA-uridine 2-sulfurtransferase